MKPNLNISDAFTLEDIRKIRNYYAERYTDESGNIDFDGMCNEIEEGAAKVRAEIARLHGEQSRQAIGQ